MREFSAGELRERGEEVAGQEFETLPPVFVVSAHATAKVIHRVVPAKQDSVICCESVVVELIRQVGDTLAGRPADAFHLRGR